MLLWGFALFFGFFFLIKRKICQQETVAHLSPCLPVPWGRFWLSSPGSLFCLKLVKPWGFPLHCPTAVSREHRGEPSCPCSGSCGCSVTLHQPPLPGAGCEQRIPIFALCFWVWFWFCSLSPRLGRSRGQVTAVGTSLSCRTRGRRAGGSELLQRRRKP